MKRSGTQKLSSLLFAAATYSLPLLPLPPSDRALTRTLSVHPVTKEPYDGVIAKIMREFSAQQNDQPKWMVLDGDIDAEWIESMNTVMDDNKRHACACLLRMAHGLILWSKCCLTLSIHRSILASAQYAAPSP